MKGLLLVVAAGVLGLVVNGDAWGQCPAGMVCPTRSVAHWTYPGDIASHLANGHGVSAAGMSREQAETLHDRLHQQARGQVSSQFSRGAVSFRGVGVRSRGVFRGMFRR